MRPAVIIVKMPMGPICEPKGYTGGHCRAAGVLRVKEAAIAALGADRLGASQDGEKGVYGAGGHHAGEQGAQYELPQTDTRRLVLIHFRVWWWELACRVGSASGALRPTHMPDTVTLGTFHDKPF